ncbi:unnamed protein product [Mytilus coruscus]|uniref:Uncharacterized protein n=1 Tax=Mytilus coruscus TaxID=42192 RepID=A0A6J8C308_MYTCO|nr:unnamed protein product [Mytilus coruscus]
MSFDVTLMVTLLRNLTKLPPPTGGYDNLPLSTDTRPTADLVRKKDYRNELAHMNDGKIESAFFITAWEDISGAVGRLGGTSIVEECKQLRLKHLDQSIVPWNIEVQNSQMLDQWRKNDVNFVQTVEAKKVLECVKKKSCVTITASSGVGKTATLQHVVLKMAGEGYDVLRLTNPQDIVKFYNPNKKTLFVMDDFCGTYSINQSAFHNWKTDLNRIKELLQNKLPKIIVACRLQVYKDEV